MSREVHRILVVEDDLSLRAAVARTLRSEAEIEVLEAGTVAEARLCLQQSPSPDLVVIDVRLPDDSIFEILDVANGMSPVPAVIAISGEASPEEAFRLAQRGVRAYLPKPFSTEDLERAVESALSDAPDLTPMLKASVGTVPLRKLQSHVRRTMTEEALARTQGSRSGAARLLQVTRQAVQQIVNSVRGPRSDDDATRKPKR